MCLPRVGQRHTAILRLPPYNHIQDRILGPANQTDSWDSLLRRTEVDPAANTTVSQLPSFLSVLEKLEVLFVRLDGAETHSTK